MESFLYFTDAHYGAQPICRKDDYNNAIIKKIQYCLEYASLKNCIVLCGGDLFDTPKIKLFDLLKIIKLFRKFKNLEIYSLMGNESHDGLRESSPLNLLKLAGLIKENKDYEDTKESRIVFANSGSDLEFFNRFIQKDRINILMTHHTIVKEPLIFEHILIQELRTDFDIILLAHYHPYQGMLKRNDGKIFIAPGSLTRRKYILSDINKIPKAVFFQIDKGKLITLDEINIPYEKDVWVEKREMEMNESEIFADVQRKVEEMKKLLQTNIHFGNLHDELKKYASDNNIEKEVIDYVLLRLNSCETI